MSEAISTSKAGWWNRIKSLIKEAKGTFREKGMRGVIQKYGWKFFAVFFCYYLVRDLFLYVFIPYMVAKGLLSGS